MQKWQRFKNVMVLKWYSIVLSVGSIGFGMYLNKYPFVINGAEEYKIIGRILGSEWFPWAFILLGVSKLTCIAFNWKRGKLMSLSLLIALWTLFGVGFYIQYLNGVPNAGWLLTAIIVAQALGISQRSNFHKGDGSDE